MVNEKSCRSMMKKKGRKGVSRKSSQNDESMEGSVPAVPAEPGTLKVVIKDDKNIQSISHLVVVI
jgi:hypothetical protein